MRIPDLKLTSHLRSYFKSDFLMAPKGSDLQSVSAYQKGQLVLLCAGKQRHCKGAAGGGGGSPPELVLAAAA